MVHLKKGVYSPKYHRYLFENIIRLVRSCHISLSQSNDTEDQHDSLFLSKWTETFSNQMEKLDKAQINEEMSH